MELLAVVVQENVVIGSAVAAILIIWASWRAAGKESNRDFHDLAGPVSFDIEASWLTTFTAIGAILGTMLDSSETLGTEGGDFSSAVGLSLLFGVLIAFAPFVFKALSRPVQVTTDGENTVGYQGYVRGLIAANTITLWAALGEMLTLLIILNALLGRAAPFYSGFIGFLIALGLLLTISYAYRTTRAVLMYQTIDGDPPSSGKPGATGYRPFSAPIEAGTIKKTPSSWSLL